MKPNKKRLPLSLGALFVCLMSGYALFWLAFPKDDWTPRHVINYENSSIPPSIIFDVTHNAIIETKAVKFAVVEGMISIGHLNPDPAIARCASDYLIELDGQQFLWSLEAQKLKDTKQIERAHNFIFFYKRVLETFAYQLDAAKTLDEYVAVVTNRETIAAIEFDARGMSESEKE